jgi:hypothetical protein
MVGQILPNNNEKCYSNFSPKFSQLNTATTNKKAGRSGDANSKLHVCILQHEQRVDEPGNDVRTSGVGWTNARKRDETTNW